MGKKQSRISWKKVLRGGNLIFHVAWRLGLFILVSGLLLFLYRGLRNQNYAIESFHVPKAFSESGINGVVFANQLLDEVQVVDDFIASVKERPTDVQSGIQPDLNFQVMGIGLTINSITYFLQEILGKKRRSIGGELIDIDQKLELTLRISGNKSKHFAIPYEEGKREEALNHLYHEAAKEVISLVDPYRLSVYYYKKDEIEKSIEIILEILANKPEETPWAYLAWGNILNKQKKPEEACEKFKKAIEYKEDFQLAYANWAWTLFRSQKYEEAIPLFEKANTGYPKSGSYYNGLAMCYRSLKNYEKAIVYYRKAGKADPEHLIWWYGNMAGVLHGDLADTIGAMNLMKEAGDKLAEGPDKYLAYSAYYYYKSDFDSTHIMTTKALEIAPRHLLALSQVSNYHYRKKEFKESIALNKRLINVLKTDLEIEDRESQLLQAYNILAMSDYEMEEYDSAFVHVQMAIDIDTTNAVPYTTLAETHAFVGDHEAFYQAVEKAVKYGFDFTKYLSEEPYIRYKDDQRFLRLVKKEEEPEKLEASLN